MKIKLFKKNQWKEPKTIVDAVKMIRKLKKMFPIAGIIWQPEDVILMAKDYSNTYHDVPEYIAKEVIYTIEKNKDCDYGINWATLECALNIELDKQVGIKKMNKAEKALHNAIKYIKAENKDPERLPQGLEKWESIVNGALNEAQELIEKAILKSTNPKVPMKGSIADNSQAEKPYRTKGIIQVDEDGTISSITIKGIEVDFRIEYRADKYKAMESEADLFDYGYEKTKDGIYVYTIELSTEPWKYNQKRM